MRKGASLLISPYILHRNPDQWTNPDTYNPENFLEEEKHSRGSFIPFGMGERTCIGAPLALLEGPKIIDSFFSRYQTTINLGSELARNVVLTPQEPISATLIKRPQQG